ncbi:MAG: ABC transporter permease [Bacteroidota bacterium]
MQTSPPKYPLRFLRWFCREDYLEEIEGDLVEIFEEQHDTTPVKAHWQFAFSVIRYFRRDFIRPLRIGPIYPTAMFKNDLKLAWRNQRKQPFFSLLNLIGLSIGLAGCLLIGLYIKDEFSFNTMFADANRIYRMDIDNRLNGETTLYASVSAPLAEALAADYPQLEMVSRCRSVGEIMLRTEASKQNTKEEHTVAVDTSFLALFGLELIVGDASTAFQDPNTLVLAESTAKKYFGSGSPIGQMVRIDDEQLYRVTGVMADPPHNSFLRNYSVFLSLNSFEDAQTVAWNTWNFPTFVKVQEGADIDHFLSFLSAVKDRYIIPWAMTFIPGLTVESSREQEKATGDYMRFGATALLDIHLHSPNREGEFNPNSSIQSVYILASIGVFLLLLACINFTNLSTVQAIKREQEVGIRKVLGSSRFSLVRQFLTQSALNMGLSLLAAILLSASVLPFFNQFTGKSLQLPLGEPYFYFLLLTTTTALSLLSGWYPAAFMSRFEPNRALKGSGREQGMGQRFSGSLLVVQFSISVGLIVATLVVFQQLNFIKNKDLGYHKEQLLIIEDIDAVAPEKLTILKERMGSITTVEAVSLSSYLPVNSARSSRTYMKEGKIGGDHAVIWQDWNIDHDYINTLGLELVAGRGFDRSFPTDSSAIVINESAAQILGASPEDILGTRLTADFHREDKENMEYVTVIGVVKNFHFESLHSDIDALSLKLGTDPRRLVARIEAGGIESAIATTQDIWETLAPAYPLNYHFVDEAFNQTYRSELKLGRIFTLFTGLSIFIASLGLFGLMAFNVERRIKEVGIRRVLGASTSQIIYVLSAQFFRWIALAVVIALPLSYYAMNHWLQDFSYRINISWWTLALAVMLSLFLAVFTITAQSIRAAMSNPIKSLRSE